MLLKDNPQDKREEAIFEIVSQFERGVALITSREEREKIAELNLVAGKRAKAAAAYASALKYFVAGTALVTEDCWKSRHDLIFQLELHRAECEFLTGDLNAADNRLTMLSSNRQSNACASIYILRFIHPIARLQLFSTTSRNRALNGRLVHRSRKCGANTRRSIYGSGTAQSSVSLNCL
jgi:predicted ATPase